MKKTRTTTTPKVETPPPPPTIKELHLRLRDKLAEVLTADTEALPAAFDAFEGEAMATLRQLQARAATIGERAVFELWVSTINEMTGHPAPAEPLPAVRGFDVAKRLGLDRASIRRGMVASVTEGRE